MLNDTLTVNAAGHLCFAGQDTAELAREYGTPLYLMSEERLRGNCRLYRESMTAGFGPESMPLFAGKSFCMKGIYPILAEEGFGADVVSGGELYTALSAGFPADRLFFHGNGKTDREIRYGVESGIGRFVVDSPEELEAVSACAQSLGKKQAILLRLTPGIDPHTFTQVNTGRLDCQFGVPLETGEALVFAEQALRSPGVELLGFHCHIGSQIFSWTPFRDAADRMLRFIRELKEKHGFETRVLNLGGGFGVRYTEDQPTVDIPASVAALAEYIKARCEEWDLKLPAVCMEPGRSIVADAGLSLYTVQALKRIEGGSNYAVVDGGMSDNPRYALYQAPYTVYCANRMNDPADLICTVAGRCCESGALLQEGVALPVPRRGDLIAMCCTGAYQYSMASNYNRVGRPPVLLLSDAGNRLIAKREEYPDLVKLDL